MEIEIPGEEKETFSSLDRFTRPESGMNNVLFSKMEEPEFDRVIKTQIEYFSQMDQPFNWKVFSHDAPATHGLVSKLMVLIIGRSRCRDGIEG